MLELTKVKAVVFDMDGLLLDSERVVLECFIEACHEFGFEPDVEVYYRCIGCNKDRTRQIIMTGYGSDFPYEDVKASWHSKSGTRPMPLKHGLLELLQYLDRRALHKVVVTSTQRHRATKMLTEAGILPRFDFLICGDDITRSKPEPDIYLKACEKLNLPPAACLALEDSDTGVLSAYRAGLQVIQVPDLLPPSAQVKALGHTIVASLDDVRLAFEVKG
jgi:beta-phosphoglucomutase-like phosphatase (HAD superfamily)